MSSRRDAGLAADVEDARRIGHAEIAHLAETIASTDGHCSEAEDRHAQPGIPKPPLFHDCLLLCLGCCECRASILGSFAVVTPLARPRNGRAPREGCSRCTYTDKGPAVRRIVTVPFRL